MRALNIILLNILHAVIVYIIVFDLYDTRCIPIHGKNMVFFNITNMPFKSLHMPGFENRQWFFRLEKAGDYRKYLGLFEGRYFFIILGSILAIGEYILLQTFSDFPGDGSNIFNDDIPVQTFVQTSDRPLKEMHLHFCVLLAVSGFIALYTSMVEL